MGMVVIQPYILVLKLKKTKTKFLRCTAYLNSIKPYKTRFIANSSSCTTTELSKLLTSCLTTVKNMLSSIVKRYMRDLVKVSKGAKIRNRYNQVPHLTQDTKTYFGLFKIQVKF